MNNVRRKAIKKEIGKLESAKMIYETLNIDRVIGFVSEIKNSIESICDEEQDAFDNMPEGLQSSIRGETSEECIDLMTEAIDLMDEIEGIEDKSEIKEHIEEVIDLLNNVIFA